MSWSFTSTQANASCAQMSSQGPLTSMQNSTSGPPCAAGLDPPHISPKGVNCMDPRLANLWTWGALLLHSDLGEQNPPSPLHLKSELNIARAQFLLLLLFWLLLVLSARVPKCSTHMMRLSSTLGPRSCYSPNPPSKSYVYRVVQGTPSCTSHLSLCAK